jgi:tetratricopeptide (TPR) repeat protein/predicted Ser/Thr protein kinase
MSETPDAADEMTLGAAGAGSASEAGELSRGATCGRYVVLARLGAGGMGVVYAAYDPELDRKVALKLLHASAGRGDEARARLMREAQALAKLSHPNIVAIHDVGTVRDRVWIAMEFVTGSTLRTWVAAAPRSWQDVIEVVAAAGHGLAAAHAAGVIHRDVKPDNIMVGDDRRVRVMDFGLARAGDRLDTAPSQETAASPAGLGSDITRAGSVIGTPAYMAPEQHAGLPTDARTDVFALCVTAWELLFGARPFGGSSLVELSTNVLEGNLRSPPTGANVPTWLRKLVHKGLAVDPSTRWPSMQAYVDALAIGRARVRTRRLVATLGALALVTVVVVASRELDRRARVAACDEAGATIAEVWNDDARDRTRDGLLTTQVSGAATAADKAIPWLDERASDWRHARTRACLFAEVERAWDEDVSARALWCLDERRAQLEALVGQFSEADATVVHKAVGAAAALTSAESCLDADALARLPLPPSERRDRIGTARADLVRADALERTGRYATGLELARDVRVRSAELEWPPLAAAAAAVEARLLVRQGDYAGGERAGAEAYFEAAKVGAWDVAASSAIDLVHVVGARRARHAEGRLWNGHAEVALAHADSGGSLREARRLANLAAIEKAEGDHAAARGLYMQSLAITEGMLGSGHPEVATSLNAIGNVDIDVGEHEHARERYQRALEIQQAALGETHPELAQTLNNLAVAWVSAGEDERARELLERALAIREQALAADHPLVAQALNNLAVLHKNAGELAKARALNERALAIQEKALGPEHPEISASLTNLAILHTMADEWAPAIALFERAVAISERALGPEHPQVAFGLGNLAEAHASAGDHAKARAAFERTRAIWEKSLGPAHTNVAYALDGEAVARLLAGDAAAALPLAERAVAIFDQHEGMQDSELRARFTLARAIVGVHGDPDRARAYAESARDGYRAAGPARAGDLAEVERWIAFGMGRGSGSAISGRGKPVPVVRVLGLDVRGALHLAAARNVVRDHRDEVRACYAKAFALDPTLHGRIEIELTIDASGKVTASTVKQTTVPDASVDACIAAAAKRWRFPKPADGGALTVVCPFSLEPA